MRTDDLYVYNQDTKTLHINKLCHNATGSAEDKFFPTENAAVRNLGRGFKICETCMKLRDEILAKIDFAEFK
ncbi:MAG: hypothetical protein K2N06_10205 [Oscillospiraceae bacterium]|nr:hypothetical protein [Oscillospiraceae bacterium]